MMDMPIDFEYRTFEYEIRQMKLAKSQSDRMEVIASRKKYFYYLGSKFAIIRFVKIRHDGRIIERRPFIECEFITSDGFAKRKFDYLQLRKALYIG